MLEKHLLIKGVYSTSLLSFDMLKSNVLIEREAVDGIEGTQRLSESTATLLNIWGCLCEELHNLQYVNKWPLIEFCPPPFFFLCSTWVHSDQTQDHVKNLVYPFILVKQAEAFRTEFLPLILHALPYPVCNDLSSIQI